MDKSKIVESKRIVVKVGTSTLTHENGKMNIRHIENLCKVLCDLQNSGKELVLVSSGAIGVGVGKLGLKSRPAETSKKRRWLPSASASSCSCTTNSSENIIRRWLRYC